MKKGTKHILTIAATFTAIYAFNKYIQISSTQKNLLTDKKGSYYEWKLGKIFYTKQGTGSPILLIHDAAPSASSEEWNKVTKKLAKKYTVYTIDLLGCGRSDKPKICYTNYMYVQLITSFIKNVIKQKTNIAATGLSTSFVTMVNHLEPELLNQIIFINPVSIVCTQMTPDWKTKIIKKMINLPLIGTFAYNICMHPIVLTSSFKKNYSKEIALKEEKYIDIYNEAAHLDNSNGKYLYSSILGRYVNIDIQKAVKAIDKPIAIISSKKIKGNRIIAGEYRKFNSKFNIYNISSDSPHPQLEDPDKILKLIKNLCI